MNLGITKESRKDCLASRKDCDEGYVDVSSGFKSTLRYCGTHYCSKLPFKHDNLQIYGVCHCACIKKPTDCDTWQ
jgi:hypothetical protein